MAVCRTSLDLRHMFFLCRLLIFHRLSSTFVLTPLWKKVGVSRQEIYHGVLRMDICYGTDRCLTLRFCDLFRDMLRDQQMRSRSLHTSSSTRREARLIPMIRLVVLFAMMMSTWVRRGWAMSSCMRPCVMLESSWQLYWLGGVGGRWGSMLSRSRTSRREGWCLGLMLDLMFMTFF